MQPDDYSQYDAVGLAERVAAGDVSAAELLRCALDATDSVNDQLNAVVHIKTSVAERLIEQGLPDGPLRGVPFLLKDLGAEAIDFPSHNGSRLFADTRYRYDSELYQRLRRAGLVTFGRTAAPELGVGPATEAQVYQGPCRNPWQLQHTPGGSSGGAGAAVAAGVVPAAHGSDGGGSVRIPAACCGLFGLKPTRARLPDGPASGEGWGGMAIDGFLTRSVRDSAVLLDACCGPDLGAPYRAPALRQSFCEAVTRPPPPLRVAYSLSSFNDAPLHPDCRRAVEHAAAKVAELGHHVDERTPNIELLALMRAWSKIVACGTALSVRKALAANGRPPGDLGGDLEGVTRGACRYAATLSGEDYLDALNAVHAFGRRLAAFFVDVDIFITPTLAEPPAKVGRFKPDNEDFLDYRLGTDGILPYSPFAPIYNASGQPAASLPLYWNDAGLPIGVQFAARFGADDTLIALAAQLEQAVPWFDRRPPLRAGSA